MKGTHSQTEWRWEKCCVIISTKYCISSGHIELRLSTVHGNCGNFGKPVKSVADECVPHQEVWQNKVWQ